jgi:hypothetical protein
LEPYLTQARNKAYERFKDACRNGDGADLGTNLAERRQAMDMMTARLLQLGRFSRRLRKLDFVGAGRELGITKDSLPKGLKPKAKAFSNNWLEYHFGWSPLVKDIGGAIDTLNKGIPPTRVRGSATVRFDTRVRDFGRPYNFSDYVQKVRVSMVADVTITNPNLWLANQLGLINPAALAWELVPFSFVVDWFGNVGNYLSSFTDFAGVAISLPCKTEFLEWHQKTQQGYLDLGWTHEYELHLMRMSRTTTNFVGPKVQFIFPWRLSASRGLTAASLLIQSMR